MSILTNVQQFMTIISVNLLPKRLANFFLIVFASGFLFQCQKPDQDIVLKQIRDVVVDATSEPVLKANAIFFNPNKIKGRIKKIKVDIYVNGKKAANVDQDFKLVVPSQSEFTVPIEVKLAIKELGFMDTVFGLLGGKKFEVRYEGFLKLSYHGIPIKVPVDYKDDVRIKF
jgi:LEA14-like dessication related protein